MRRILIGLAAAAVLFGFFYVYKGEIFEAVIIEDNGTYTKDLPLSSVLFSQDLPDFVDQERLVKISPTVKTWVLLIAIFIGMPVMIALRFGREPKEKDS